MSGSIPYLGSKISLISKSEIRYEGILYTIDAQESIIALAKVRSFGTEDRPTEMPVPARDEVYEYIIFRGTDIKTIEVCDTPKVSSLHNDPAIVQHSAPTVAPVGPASTGSAVGASFQQSSFHRQSLGPIGGAVGSGIGQNLTYSSGSSFGSAPQPLQQSSVIQSSFMSGSNQPNILADVLSGSRSSTPALRKSPVSDAGVQVSPPTVQSPPERKPLPQRQQNNQERQPRENYNAQRRPLGANPPQYNRENPNQGFQQHQQRDYQGYNRDFQRNDYRDHQRDYREKIRGDVRDYNGENRGDMREYRDPRVDNRDRQRMDGRDYYNREGAAQRENQGFHREGGYQGGYRENHPSNYQNRTGGYFQGGYGQGGGGSGGGYYPQPMHMANRGGRMTRRPNPNRGVRGGFPTGTRGGKQDTTRYDKEFDFEQANEEFEELKNKFAQAQISDKVSEDGDAVVKEVEPKEDSGHETAPGEDSEDSASSTTCYDKTKSFFDTISCEAIERVKGRSQRPDWRQERKINVQTFGVATARRGFYQRGRGYYNNRGGYYNNKNSFGNQGYYNNRGGGQSSRGNIRAASNETNITNGTTDERSKVEIAPAASTYASTVRNSAETAAK